MKKSGVLFNSLFGATAAAMLLGALHAAARVARHGYLARGFPETARSVFREMAEAYFVRGLYAGITLAAFLALARVIRKDPTRRRRTLMLTAPFLLALVVLVAAAAIVIVRAPLADQFEAGLSPRLIFSRIVLPALTDPVSIPRALIALASFLLLASSFILAAAVERIIFRKAPAPIEERQRSKKIGAAGTAVIFLMLISYVVLRPTPPAPALPDIVLISLDTVRADHLGCYGYARPTSPNIDRFAREGILVEQCVSHSPWTLPAHISMFTGLHPFEHGVTDITRALPPTRTVLAEVLKERGYATGGFVSNYLLSPTFGYGSGFDDYVLRADFPAEEVTRLASNWLARKPKPAFLFVHLFDAHYPYAPRLAFRGKFGPPEDGLDAIMKKPFFDFAKEALSYDDKRLADVVRRYDEEILDLDTQLGRFFDALRAAGRYDDAWIVLTADHGEEFRDHGLFGHSITLYDEMLRVPLIVKPPDSACAGTRVADASIPQKAIFALIENIAHPPKPEGLDCAKSASPAFLLDLAARDGVLSETDVFAPHRFSIRKDGRKLIQPYQFSVPPFTVDRQMECYDLVSDPGEQKNLYEPGEAQDLLDLIARADAARKAAGGADVGASTLSPEAREKLKSLGYVQ